MLHILFLSPQLHMDKNMPSASCYDDDGALLSDYNSLPFATLNDLCRANERIL